MTRDAAALAAAPAPLFEAKLRIDHAVRARDMRALYHWTDVWFEIQRLRLRAPAQI